MGWNGKIEAFKNEINSPERSHYDSPTIIPIENSVLNKSGVLREVGVLVLKGIRYKSILLFFSWSQADLFDLLEVVTRSPNVCNSQSWVKPCQDSC